MTNFLERMLDAAGIFNCQLVINRWLGEEDADAIASIFDFIDNASTAQIDMMDAALLGYTITFGLDMETRLRVVKFYAALKCQETVHYGKFRGFPQFD